MNPQYYQVKVGNYAVDKDEIHHPIGQEDIHFIPVISGAGRGVGKVLLGAALIAGAFILGPAGFMTASAAAGTATTATVIAKSAVYLGASLALQGVSEMLFPLPKPREFSSEQDPRVSFSFLELKIHQEQEHLYQ